MLLQLDRPLVFFDLETTGTDIATSRIVEIAALRVEPSGSEQRWHTYINPQVPIPPESTAVHGITDEQVASSPVLSDVRRELLGMFEGADIAGYNSMRFDVPLLAEECVRHGIPFDASAHRQLDAYRIFQLMEPHTLTAAYRKYCGKELEGAHSAMVDAEATRDVLFAQLASYATLPRDVQELAAFCEGDRRGADLAGRLGYNSRGEVVFNFGKHKGEVVAEVFSRDRSYYDWIMNSDFPTSTKQVLTKIMEASRGRK